MLKINKVSMSFGVILSITSIALISSCNTNSRGVKLVGAQCSVSQNQIAVSVINTITDILGESNPQQFGILCLKNIDNSPSLLTTGIIADAGPEVVTLDGTSEFTLNPGDVITCAVSSAQTQGAFDFDSSLTVQATCS